MIGNFRIGVRLSVGFGVLVAIGLATAAFGYGQLNSISTKVMRMADQSQNAIGVVKISADLHAASRAMLRYQNDRDQASYAEAEARLSSAAGTLEATIRRTVSQERLAAYRLLQPEIASLNDKRLALGNVLQAYFAGRDALFVDGDRLAADLRKLVGAGQGTTEAAAFAALELTVNTARISVWRHLATHEVKPRDAFAAELGRARAQIADLEGRESGTLAGMIATVKADLAAYAGSFDKASGNLLRGREIYANEIAPLTRSAIERIEKVESGIRSNYAATVAETSGLIDGASEVQLATAFAAALLGAACAFLMARSITGPLRVLVDESGRLSAGDTSVEFLGARRRDEVGQLAGAIAKFRDNVLAGPAAGRAGRGRGGRAPRGGQPQHGACGRGVQARRRRAARQGRRECRHHEAHRERADQHLCAGDAAGRGRRRCIGADRLERPDRGCSGRGARRLDPGDRPPDRTLQRHGAISQYHDRAVRKRDRGPRSGGPEHLLRGRPDPGDRSADQPAGAQCDHRGRACRRGRPRLRGRGAGGQVARRADRTGDPGDRPARSGHPDVDRKCGGIREAGRGRDARDRRSHGRDRQRGRTAGGCDARDLGERADGGVRLAHAGLEHRHSERSDPPDQPVGRPGLQLVGPGLAGGRAAGGGSPQLLRQAAHRRAGPPEAGRRGLQGAGAASELHCRGDRQAKERRMSWPAGSKRRLVWNDWGMVCLASFRT
ncbi:exported hypothetical protein [Bradyrhizobium sp. STM 3809]|nr:exported hypothetical protein [Bradyrhizobium sp. STM 3809]